MARRPAFHTGEFAKITGVNKRTLHYYDSEGIFRPDHIAENGYRSYSFRQIYPFHLIRTMRGMGLELGEIKRYMEERSPENLRSLLKSQEIWLDEEIKTLTRKRTIVRKQRERLTATTALQLDEVREEDWPKATLLLSAPTRSFEEHGNHAAVEKVIAEHLRYVLTHDIYAGLSFGAMVETGDYMTPGKESLICHYFTPTDVPLRHLPRELRHERPAGRYLVTCFAGNYMNTASAYARLRSYIEEHALTPRGFSYEESLIDEISAANEADYITRIAIRIAEANPG